MVKLAYRLRSWPIPVSCRHCDHLTTKGFTHPNDTDEPPLNALCEQCYHLITTTDLTPT